MIQYVEPMSGSEIAKELNCTRQAVSNSLKNSMKKCYIETKKMDKTWPPFECVCVMMKMFNIPNDEIQIRKFFNLFPPDIKEEIIKDLTDRKIR